MADFLITHQWQMWAVAALVFLVVELMVGDFSMLCLAMGAVVSVVVALLGGSFLSCLAFFAAATLAGLIFFRPKFLKRIRGKKVRKSNADALDGSIGVVREEIPAGGFGYVALDGDMWRSVSESGEAIAVGTKVEVLSHESIILTVRPVAANKLS